MVTPFITPDIVHLVKSNSHYNQSLRPTPYLLDGGLNPGGGGPPDGNPGGGNAALPGNPAGGNPPGKPGGGAVFTMSAYILPSAWKIRGCEKRQKTYVRHDQGTPGEVHHQGSRGTPGEERRLRRQEQGQPARWEARHVQRAAPLPVQHPKSR